MAPYGCTNCNCTQCRRIFGYVRQTEITYSYATILTSQEVVYRTPGRYWDQAPRAVRVRALLLPCRPQRAQSRKCFKSVQRWKRRRFNQKIRA